MKRKTILFVLLFIVVFSTFCYLFKSDNNSRVGYVSILQIKNKSLLSILDSIISHEKQCAYYSPELIFSIHSQVVNDITTEYQVGAIGSWLVDHGGNQYKGCFEYKRHWFFVEGQDLDSTVFKTTAEKKEFIFFKSDEKTREGDLILNVIDDDTFSFWIYDYTDNVFLLKEMYDFYCDCSMM
ncbi:MAG: hypothetical protein IJJ72_09730 [Bacteroidales bacterium]|nr:hypothetical protein [Bacteroidales bacterium]